VELPEVERDFMDGGAEGDLALLARVVRPFGGGGLLGSPEEPGEVVSPVPGFKDRGLVVSVDDSVRKPPRPGFNIEGPLAVSTLAWEESNLSCVFEAVIVVLVLAVVVLVEEKRLFEAPRGVRGATSEEERSSEKSLRVWCFSRPDFGPLMIFGCREERLRL
jgi:hypothetical protein